MDTATTTDMAARPLLWRGAIVVVALLASAGVLRAGAAQMLSRSDPMRATAFAPDNARIAMDAARDATQRNVAATDPRIRALTLAALERDPTVTNAIELRALQAEADGEAAREAALFDLSGAISRRSLPTRLWLIQRSVDRGDVGGALRDFDVALRTSMTAPNVLFPILAEATTDPELVVPIARMVDRPSDWRVMFLNHAVAHGNAEGITAVVLRLRDRALVTGNGVDQALIARLVSERQFALAGQVRDTFRPVGGTHPLVADGRFADPAALFPFGWSLTGRGDAGSERSIVNGRTMLAWRAEPGREGQVAAQLLLLAPGSYRLSTTAASTGDAEALPYWSLGCGEQGGGVLARLDVPVASGASGSANFTVPQGCAGQWLTLILRPGGGSGGRSGAVAGVAVTRR